MPFDLERRRSLFRELGRRGGKVAGKRTPGSVRKFRTSCRRVEVLLEEFPASPNRKEKKLLKLLSRLRRRAGCLRDLDVQIQALQNLRLPQESARKAQLLRTLLDERTRQEKRLERAFDRDTVRELRWRLKRAAEGTGESHRDPLALARRQLSRLEKMASSPNEETLHSYRMAGKRARHLAEMSLDKAAAEPLIEVLKRMQDALGDWHDWLQLSNRSGDLFGRPEDSALVAALRNVTGAKFRHAVEVLADTRGWLAEKKPPRKQPATARKDSHITAAA